MNRSLKAFVAISTVFACLSGSFAIAGGLSSKDKARTPFAAGALTIMGARSMPSSAFIKTIKMRNQTKISAKIRKDLRAQARTFGAAAMETKPALFSTSNQYVNPERIVDREKLVKRGMSAHPLECAKLHTHERAICQRDAQLRKNSNHQLRLALGK